VAVGGPSMLLQCKTRVVGEHITRRSSS